MANVWYSLIGDAKIKEMSAIADFRIIKTDKLDALKEASEIIIKKSFFKKTNGCFMVLPTTRRKLQKVNHSQPRIPKGFPWSRP